MGLLLPFLFTASILSKINVDDDYEQQKKRRLSAVFAPLLVNTSTAKVRVRVMARIKVRVRDRARFRDRLGLRLKLVVTNVVYVVW